MEKTAKAKKPLSLKTRLLLVLLPLIFVYTWVLTAVNSGYIMDGNPGHAGKDHG